MGSRMSEEQDSVPSGQQDDQTNDFLTKNFLKNNIKDIGIATLLIIASISSSFLILVCYTLCYAFNVWLKEPIESYRRSYLNIRPGLPFVNYTER